MTYSLHIPAEDWLTICLVGHRYAWSEKLISYAGLLGRWSDEDGPGFDSIPEHIAWEIAAAFESDTDGGHSMFPMLDPNSELYARLASFLERIA